MNGAGIVDFRELSYWAYHFGNLIEGALFEKPSRGQSVQKLLKLLICRSCSI